MGPSGVRAVRAARASTRARTSPEPTHPPRRVSRTSNEDRMAIGRLMLSTALAPVASASPDELVDLRCEQLLTWLYGEPVCGRPLDPSGDLGRAQAILTVLHLHAATRTASIPPWVDILEDHMRWMNLASPAAGKLGSLVGQVASMRSG